jgi:hypothetical protein
MTSTARPVRSSQRSPVLSSGGLNPSVVFEVPVGWYPKIYSVNLTPYWRNVPCGDDHKDISGMSYYLFTKPCPTRSFSAFFDPYSPYFHVIAGVYIIVSTEGWRVPLETLSTLSVNDMFAMFRRLGGPQLSSSVDDVMLTPTGVERWYVELKGRRGHLYNGRHMPQQGLPPIWTVPNSPVAGTSHWSDLIDDYADTGYFMIGDAWYHHDYLIWNWWAGVRFIDKLGDLHDTLQYPCVIEEAKQIATSVRIIDRGIGLITPSAWWN